MIDVRAFPGLKRGLHRWICAGRYGIVDNAAGSRNCFRMAHLAFPARSFQSASTLIEPPALWHLCRADSPPVTVVLTAAHGHILLDVSYGVVARQRVVCADVLEAVQRAERLRGRLEACGYRRTRRDRRHAAASARCA